MDEALEQDNPVVNDNPVIEVPVDAPGNPVEEKPKAKKKKSEKPAAEEPSVIDPDKYHKLVEGATKALAQYRIGHKKLTYPGFKELAEGLGETPE